MYNIIVGGGKVGYYLAKSLLEQEHEIRLIEREPRRYAALRDELAAAVLLGDGCDVMTMLRAGLDRASAVIAVTGDDEDNLVICQIARHRFNVPRTVARINNPRNKNIFQRLGIDVTVSSTEVILAQIEQFLPTESLAHLLTLRSVGISFVEIEVPGNSPALGRPLKALGIPDDSIFPLVIREGKEAVIPYGETVLQVGDRVVAVTSEASKTTLRRILLG
ncbi:MAG: TrkA family potassium uptake protein [Anaerolineae bacterium]|nr:TrkA family potassium uptake protein [Anaerolineae bacterium]